MEKIGIVSGWNGRGNLQEYKENRDGVDDYIIDTIDRLKGDFNVISNRDDIRRQKNEISIEMHFNVQVPITKACKVCILMEDQSIRPQNLLVNMINYKKVITWDRTHTKDNRFEWMPYPHNFIEAKIDDPPKRDKHFVMLASNRNLLFDSKLSLYNERQKIITYFERNSPDLFELYGNGWNNKFSAPGFISRFRQEVMKKIGGNDNSHLELRVWKGIAKSKYSVLQNAKFNICYENKLEINGYVSEKIYDSFVSGAIPIYIPSSKFNEDLVQKDMYIDPRDFDGFESLIKYCLSLTNKEIVDWQCRMSQFIKERSALLSTKHFAEKICKITNSL